MSLSDILQGDGLADLDLDPTLRNDVAKASRIDHAPETLNVVIDSVVAGRDIDLLIEDSLHQVGAGTAGNVRVYVQKTGFQSDYSIHFTTPKTESGVLARDRAAYVSASGSTGCWVSTECSSAIMLCTAWPSSCASVATSRRRPV